MGFATPSLKGRALRLLSGREHSRLELERKLAQFEEEPGSLAAALDDLQERIALDMHPAEQNHIGPTQMTVAELLHVGVNEPLLP